MQRKYLIISFYFLISVVSAQDFTRQDSLRGKLTSLRTCYDVTFYELFIIIDEKDKSIDSSYNIIHFTVKSNFKILQIDLAYNMEIQKIEFEDVQLDFERDFDAVYIYFPRQINVNEKHKIKIYYNGKPREAVNPPWDGGFSWKEDVNKNTWITVSCQGLGASIWWPCKDHQSDEPDSMSITCVARYPLKILSNGNIRKDTSEWNQSLNAMVNKTEWFVSYPINNYNVSLYIGDYSHFSDIYISEADTLLLDYYVLSDNVIKAQSHFKQVKPMLSCFESYFGKYPFWKDGYAIIETPYLGMEHQSAIAYGNNFLPGYYGNIGYIDSLNFDFIIVHESGHEWWGNSITTNDIADMWVHEGFCTYSEALYVECLYGYQAMLSYVNNQKNHVRNDRPILGAYHVNHQGSTDMYSKGSLMLHTLRTVINNDSIWFSIIKGLNTNYKNQTIDGETVIKYINQNTFRDFSMFFIQYLQYKDIPKFQYKFEKQGKHQTLLYRWDAIDGFDMPLLINTGLEDFWIHPQTVWKEIDLGVFDPINFIIRDDLFFIDIKKM